LRPYGYQLGLIDTDQFSRLTQRKHHIDAGKNHLEKTHLEFEGKSTTLAKLLCRPEFNYCTLLETFPDKVENFSPDIQAAIEVDLKYAGYINREKKDAEKLESLDTHLIPNGFDYRKIVGLRNEAREKLLHHQPTNLGQASRISGVSPADISILMVALNR
ncbi:MAG: tRNA uridine-5-carboxymethylaminomethyl(34) synthesis enzyme MnmG, partial [Chlamydiia bacterium]|nr:tRNA uridine-5-carboxymethylaminomethyl(34) synthesis enzyme MnmG [Chlamydiia bacterium]